jgi:hypothetical protein
MYMPEPNVFELGGAEPAVSEELGRAWYSEENVKGDDLEESVDAEELQDIDIAPAEARIAWVVQGLRIYERTQLGQVQRTCLWRKASTPRSRRWGYSRCD